MCCLSHMAQPDTFCLSCISSVHGQIHFCWQKRASQATPSFLGQAKLHNVLPGTRNRKCTWDFYALEITWVSSKDCEGRRTMWPNELLLEYLFVCLRMCRDVSALCGIFIMDSGKSIIVEHVRKCKADLKVPTKVLLAYLPANLAGATKWRLHFAEQYVADHR